MLGARSARQGTGPFIAGAFNRLGADVCAVVGTRASTLDQALKSLATKQGILCTGYTDLAAAISAEKPDAVAVCSPYPFHADHLALVAAADCHALVEKPLAWPAGEEEGSTLIEGFYQRGLQLQMVTQWPQTLPAFTTLHGRLPETITDFAMGLSPIPIGPGMVPDAAPHFISMLQALLGSGQCERVAIKLSGATVDAPDKLVLACDYRHEAGQTRARLFLETCEQRPRPAWYQINERRADREVELPHYTQHLVSGDKRATLNDPLEGVVGQFLARLAGKVPTDKAKLLLSHENLLQLADAWPRNN